MVTTVGKYERKRCEVRVEKREIRWEIEFKDRIVAALSLRWMMRVLKLTFEDVTPSTTHFHPSHLGKLADDEKKPESK